MSRKFQECSGDLLLLIATSVRVMSLGTWRATQILYGELFS